MDKTKLEHDLETAETQKTFLIKNKLLVFILIFIILGIFFMINLKSTLSSHEKKIEELEKQISTFRNDLEKIKTVEKGESK